MAIFVNTTGHTTLDVGICARCKCAYPRDELTPDPNAPGLMVCPDGCKDIYDPYRLPAPPADRVSVTNPRPDESLALAYSGAVPVPLFTDKPFTVDRLGPARPWHKNKLYRAGDTCTPLNVDLDTTVLPQNWWMCVHGGTSGSSPPDWPTEPGVLLGDYIALTSDTGIGAVVRILDDARLLSITDDDRAKYLITADTFIPVDAGLHLLSDSGIKIFAESNGDGTVCWLNLGIYPM